MRHSTMLQRKTELARPLGDPLELLAVPGCTGIIHRATLVKRAERSGLVYGVRPLYKG